MTPWYKDPVSLAGASLFLVTADGWWFHNFAYLFIGVAVIYLGCCITANKDTTITITIEEKE